MSVVIIDYGMGNLNSVGRALEEVGADVMISDSPEDVRNATSLVLPGVGAFSEGMSNLEGSGLAEVIRQTVSESEVPLLGICLGMQLLASRGTEGGAVDGLGLIPGSVEAMVPGEGERIPHVGWNEVNPLKQHPMFCDIEDGTDFYFVHSYCFRDGGEAAIACTPYASGVTSAVCKNNVWGTQFHPEKSSKPGLRLLANFISS